MNPTKRDQLIRLLNHARAVQEKVFAEMSEAQRTAFGTWEHWAPKDFLAHIIYYENRFADNMSQLETLDSLSNGEVEAVNRENYERNASRTYDEIAADAARIKAKLVAQTQRFDDAQLTEPNQFPVLQGGRLDGRILGNGYTHPLTHLSQMCIAHGDTERARQIQEDSTKLVLEYDPSPNQRAVALYNLACFCALNGESDRAIELLRESFPLRADLIEFSKQDSDLDSLRELPAYQALYQ